MTKNTSLLKAIANQTHSELWRKDLSGLGKGSISSRLRLLLYIDSLIKKLQSTETDTLNSFKEALQSLYSKEFRKENSQLLADLNRLNISNINVTNIEQVTPDLWHRYFLQQLEQIKAEVNKLPNDENKACLLAALVLYEGHLEVHYAEDIKKAAIEKALLSLEGRKILDFSKDEAGKMPAQRRQETIAAIFAAYQLNPNDPVLGSIPGISNLPAKVQAQVKATLDKSLAALEPFAAYGEISLNNHLVDKLQHTITEHLSFKRGELTPGQSRFIAGLKAAMIQGGDPSQQVRDYFNKNATHIGYSGRLERHIERTLARHARQKGQEDKVNLKIKVWGKPEDRQTLLQTMGDRVALSASTQNKPLKVVLMVHGLQDSVDTFNEMAKQYVARGYTVISYDHAGHGFDPRRRSGNQLDLAQIQADFYGVVNKLYDSKQVASMDIVAHSMGSALVAQSIGFLEARNGIIPPIPKDTSRGAHFFSKQQPVVSPPPATPKITSVKLFAQPYISFWDVLKNLPQYLKDSSNMNSEVKMARSQGVSRIGGPGLTFGFFNFLKQGYEALKYYQQQGTQSLQVEVHVSTQDKVAPAEKIAALFSSKTSGATQVAESVIPAESAKKAVELVTHKGEGHHFHYEYQPDLPKGP